MYDRYTIQFKQVYNFIWLYIILRERVIYMATKSLLKNVDIKDKKLGKSLVIALEHASNKRTAEVQLSRTYEDVRGEKLRRIFDK